MNQPGLLSRLYRLKLVIVGMSLVASGLLLTGLADWLESLDAPHLIVSLAASLSDVLLVTGAIGIAVDFFTERDRDRAATARTRAVLSELTPEFTDAVIRSFGVNRKDLERVASPALLDDIATNVLSLRLGDDQFAREIYADVRDQAIRAPERWYDVQVGVRLSTAVERSTEGAPRFDVLVEWEYTVTPSRPVARFACVSDRDEFYDLVTDIPSTMTWFMTPRPGFDARQRESYELLSFSVDGEDRRIRRSERRTGQTYSATIGEDVVRAGKPVRIKQIYRTVTPKSGHRLFLEIPQPARGVSIELDYTDADISHLSVSDLVTSIQKPRISRLPQQVPAKVVSVDIPGWLLPRAGFTFVWTLTSEAAPASRAAARPDARAS